MPDIVQRQFDSKIEDQVVMIVYKNEWKTGLTNQSVRNEDLRSYLDLVDSVRGERDYDWMSNVRIPEFSSQMLTQSSIDVGQYFQTRDFVEVYIEDEGPATQAAAAATKECVNRTLNQRHLHHYLKFVRGKTMNHLAGQVFIVCWWERENRAQVTGYNERQIPQDHDVFGQPMLYDFQQPAMTVEREPVVEQVPVIDRFNYDIIDPRNVVTSNEYTYTLQEKDYILVRDEVSFQDLVEEKEISNYFNLERVREELIPQTETQTSQETYNEEERQQKPANTISNKKFDRIKRWGKFWCTVVDTDEAGNPARVEPGIDENGVPIEGAALLEVIMVFVVSGDTAILIGFDLTPYVDVLGNPYRNIIRGLCYIHPTMDDGIGDAQYARELQIAIDDTFNVSQDRTMLATMPTFKGRKSLARQTDTVYWEPGHMIEMGDLNDLQEMILQDNIQGAIIQIQYLTNKMQQTTSIYPTTMGDVPGLASTTATAVAGAEGRTNMRSNYKSLTYEHTVLSEMYWMIQQMTFRFAHPTTGVKLMGEKVFAFNPQLDFTYKPVSQSIETEHSKMAKLKVWQLILNIVARIGHPDTARLINYILQKMFEHLGDEFVNFGKYQLNPQIPVQPATGGGRGTAAGGGAGLIEGGGGASNQAGVPQSDTEIAAREGTF